MDPRERATSV